MSSAQLKKFATVSPAALEWRDGLPFSLEFNDIYFSSDGAVAESTHVFIEGNHLLEDWRNKKQATHYIAELGFGCGLNFLNTAKHWQAHVNSIAQSNIKHEQGAKDRDSVNAISKEAPHLHYLSIEKRPFSISDLEKTLSLWPEFKDFSTPLIDNYPSTTYGRHQLSFSKNNLTLTLFFMPIEDALRDLNSEFQARKPQLNIDHWFLDGFAPSKNQSMWGESVAQAIAKLSKISTRLATYSVAGVVKNPLKDAGFLISKRKGFGSKREMLTGIFKTSSSAKIPNARFINIKHDKPWFNFENKIDDQRETSSTVAIIGAGIAGCSLAYSLSKRNIHCDLYEKNSQIASGASGAAAGIFHPQITTDMNYSSQFSWLAYQTLLRFLNGLSDQQSTGLSLSSGLTRFLSSESVANQLLELASALNLESWIKNDSNQFNNSRAIHYPHAGALNIKELCQLYLDLAGMGKNKSTSQIIMAKNIDGCEFKNNTWKLTTGKQQRQYQHIAYCGGAKSTLFERFNDLATNTTRGQTCHIQGTELDKNLPGTICEQVYLVPKGDGSVHIGASFEEFEEDNLNACSQQDILSKTQDFLLELGITDSIFDHINQIPLKGTVGYRLHSQDRLPIVGAAYSPAKLNDEFYQFGQKRILSSSISSYNKPGLWLNTGYGSHGLLYSLLCSEHVASLISNQISPLTKSLSDSINPARFFIKTIK
ncbi:MAG: FAD-dependent 5-carboxymethylaminomethyl-2-thiouridine(34) oxidoreductase MnmC [Kangiellaceae bacterium]|nr:FAD-dependent 5-carboxymethylaminomethyl-2-thiouridine(34) oxidoreductase MnmC [Kangiellaceae bacterium]